MILNSFKKIIFIALLWGLNATAQTVSDNDALWSIHGQATGIAQYKGDFNSPYYGSKSLLTPSEGDVTKSYTETVTGFFALRLPSGTTFIYNPEAFQGVPYSGLSGLGGFNNGELQKGAEVPAIYYNARALVTQTWNFGGSPVTLEDGFNQVAQTTSAHRLSVSYGHFSALDYFDQNAYSHDPRTQFLNWSIMASGAYDYAANSRGYTEGVVVEYFHDDWTLRAARLAMPVTPNVLALDSNLTDQHGDQVELTHEHQLFGNIGHVRFLVFENKGLMASYQDAIALGQINQQVPNILDARQPNQYKHGFAINIDQQLDQSMGAFLRYSSNDGRTETQAFTDIAQSLSGGLVINRALGDQWGLAFAQNRLRNDEIEYLELGGVTMFIGDQQGLNYRPESIFETYYSHPIGKGWIVSADFQRIANPGYNADRGPVNFYGLRAHIEF